MIRKSQFALMEIVSRERAAFAKREMEYWLAEAEEWRRLRESADPSAEKIPIQLDWCPEFNGR
jgi:hypothetical protein